MKKRKEKKRRSWNTYSLVEKTDPKIITTISRNMADVSTGGHHVI